MTDDPIDFFRRPTWHCRWQVPKGEKHGDAIEVELGSNLRSAAAETVMAEMINSLFKAEAIQTAISLH